MYTHARIIRKARGTIASSRLIPRYTRVEIERLLPMVVVVAVVAAEEARRKKKQQEEGRPVLKCLSSCTTSTTCLRLLLKV